MQNFGESVYYRPAAARAAASGMQTHTVCWSVSWAPRAHRQHSHHDDRWSRESCNVLKDSSMVWHGKRRQCCRGCSGPRRRYVTRADLRKYGAALGCAACSDTVVHGKTAKPHTDECWAVIGQQMGRDPEGHESFCKSTNAGEMENLRLKRPRRQA